MTSPSDKPALEAPNTKPLFLFVEQGPAKGQAFHIVQGSCLIGRDAVVDLCLEHPSVSHRHAQLKRSGNQLYVRDLGSHNGVYVNKQRIFHETEVFAGDTISIGTSLLKLKDALLVERGLPPGRQPHRKPTHSFQSPYSPVLIASLTTSLSTLVAMVLLKLFFQPAAPLAEVEITPVQTEEPVAQEPHNHLPLPEVSPPGLAEYVPSPDEAEAPSPPISHASILQAFRQGHAENALWQAQTAQHLLLAEQLVAFLAKWEAAENLWKEVFKTTPPHTRQALVAHDEALLEATRISADSSYVRELQTRIRTLKRMGPPKTASPSKASAPVPPVRTPLPPAKQPPAAVPRELQERRRMIDQAFEDTP